MVKKLCIVFIAFFVSQIYAQEGTNSPYSFYGIGTLKFKGTAENRSMGELSIYSDSIHINLRNPASNVSKNLQAYGSESRPVKFAVGASHSENRLETTNQSDNTSSSTFDYLVLSFPISKKLGVGMGLIPFTSVGYNLEATDVVADTILPVNRYSGEGGVNKATLSLGYMLAKDLRIGLEANYNFGNIQNRAIELVYDEEAVPLQYQSRQRNRSDLSGLNFNFGVIYSPMINDKFQLTTSFTFSPQSELVSKNERIIETIAINPFSDIEFPVDEIVVDLGDLQETDLTLPAQMSIGAGIGQPRIWFIGAEYTYLQASEFANPVISIDDIGFENASGFHIGGFWIPRYRSFNNYWSRVTYRAGARFEDTGLVVNGESIGEFGISFGAGLPVGRLFSNANIGFEYGQRGTTSNNLVKENFLNFFISLSLNDRWFQKRKLN